MSFLDKISERVGGFFDEVMLPEEVARSIQRASKAIEREEYEDALRILYRAYTDHPDFHRIHHLIGLCKFHQQSWQEALSAFDRAIEHREEAISHFYAGLAAEQLRRHHEAQVHFRRALELFDDDSMRFDLRFGLGRSYLAQGRADKAVRELKKALKHSPGQPEATVMLARALLERSKLAEAARILDGSPARSAGLPAWVLRGEIEEARGAPDEALTAYERALEAETDHLGALIGAARASLACGDHARANDYLLRAVDGADADDQLAEIHALLGRVNQAIDNRERAAQCYRASLAIDDGRVDALLGAARLALEDGLVDRARERFTAALGASRGDDASRRQALMGLARVDLAAGDLGGARRLIDQLLQHEDQPPPDVLHLLGQVALAAGDPAEALVALEQAVRVAGEPDAALEADLRQALGELTFDWTLPGKLTDATDLTGLLGQLRDFVGSDPRSDHLLGRVQQMLGALNSPLSLAIVGEFNAGKSTLLNALIGEEVVPMGVLPTTAHTCYIQYGPRKAARVVRKSGEAVEVNLAEAKRQMKTEADDIGHLEFVYPHPDLRSVEFWDTPGFNALQDPHEQTASRALEEAEAILWVLDANQALSQSEFELIESVPDGAERLLVVLNKVDRLGDADARAEHIDELLEYVEENAAGRIAGCFAISALEALEARTDDVPDEQDTRLEQSGFGEFHAFLESRIIERSGRIKTLEISRQIRALVEDLARLEASLIDKYTTLGEEVDELLAWLETTADDQPDQRARDEARLVEDRFDFVLTGIERELREAITSRGTWLTRRVLSEEDKQFVLGLLAERIEDVLERSRQTVLSDLGQLESNLAQQVGHIVQRLPLGDARAMNRRLEGFFDEARVLKLLLEERVYGRMHARATGQIEAAGRNALEEIRHLDEDDSAAWKGPLRRLLPDVRSHLSHELAAWYAEFFLAAHRFCDRVQRDLLLLKLEAEHHFDVSQLAALVGAEEPSSGQSQHI